MKKLLTLLGLTAVAGTVAISTAINKKAKEIKALEYESYIPMESSFFTNWTDDAGVFADKNATFWGENYHFQAMDTFYRGEANEGWTGTLVSRTWKQSTQYIYFTFGGARNFDVTGDPVHINVYYGDHIGNIYNDTFVENPMLLRYFKIPDNTFSELKASGDDFDMHIEIVDYQTKGYGFANFGYLHVNQTEEQVSDAMRYYLNNMNLDSREWEVNKRKQILENYYLNGGLRELFLKPVDNIDEDFESNNEFLNHWYFDYAYANGGNWDMHFDKAIGFDYARPDENTMMPFNKTGNGFFRGWYENDALGGFVSGDNSIYRFVSRPFVLSGTGLVSIKMAGTASLHVIDTNTNTDLVWADLLTFSYDGDQVNLATSNFNTVTMVRHVINLEAYVGRTIQLAIADVKDNSWSALYVDELETDYETAPEYKVDVFTQSNNSGTFNAYRTDKYINSSLYNGESNPTGLKMVLENAINQENDNAILNHVDQSASKEAYDFLQTYYEALRSPNNEFNYSKVASETQASVVNAYKALSSAAKEIVDGSRDIKYSETFESEWWKNAIDNQDEISYEFSTLVESFTTFTVSFDANGGTGEMADVPEIKGSYEIPDNGFTAPDGYQFEGWKVNGEGETIPAHQSIDVTANVTLVAQWELISSVSYTITFDANGGTGSFGPVVKGEGVLYSLPANPYTAPEGYTFVGWKVGNDAEIRQPGYKITVNGDVTIVAQWSELPNALTGTVVVTGIEMYGETLVASVIDTNNTGVLSFQWKRNDVAIEGATSNEYTIVVEDISNDLSVEVTSSVETGSISAFVGMVTKRWNGDAPTGLTTTPCTNENNNDGTINGVTTAMEYRPYETYDYKPCEGSTVYGLAAGDYYVRYKETETHQASPLTLVTVGEYVAPEKFAVTVVDGKANVTSAASGEVVTITANAPKTGYGFDKWVSDDVEFADETSASTTFVMPEKDVEIKATYKELPPTLCVVSFDANGGTGTMETVEVVKGSQYLIPACTFTAPEGKEFDGWLIGSVKYQVGEKITIAGDTTFKASWKVAEQEKPEEKEDESEGKQEESGEPKSILETVKDFFVDLYKKIVKFFQELIANFTE